MAVALESRPCCSRFFTLLFIPVVLAAGGTPLRRRAPTNLDGYLALAWDTNIAFTLFMSEGTPPIDVVSLLGNFFNDLQKRQLRGIRTFGGILYEQLLLAIAADACSHEEGAQPFVFLIPMAEGGMWREMVDWEPEQDSVAGL